MIKTRLLVNIIITWKCWCFFCSIYNQLGRSSGKNFNKADTVLYWSKIPQLPIHQGIYPKFIIIKVLDVQHCSWLAHHTNIGTILHGISQSVYSRYGLSILLIESSSAVTTALCAPSYVRQLPNALSSVLPWPPPPPGDLPYDYHRVELIKREYVSNSLLETFYNILHNIIMVTMWVV